MRKGAWIVLIALGLLLGVRLLLPGMIRWQVNRNLATLPEYEGQLEDVDLAVWRGSCYFQNLEIRHKHDDFSLAIKELSVNVDWSELLRQTLVIQVDITSPEARILVEKPVKAVEKTAEKAEAVERAVEEKTGKSLPDLVADMVPFRVKEFRLTDGVIRVQEAGQNPKLERSEPDEGKEGLLEAKMSDLTISVKNLTNLAPGSDTPNASGEVSAKIMEKGKLKMNLKINPVARQPTFDLNLKLTRVDLRELNPLFRWQWDVDVKTGWFAMFVEAAAKEGRFKGYVKPFLQNVEMGGGQQDKNKQLGAKIKETLVDIAIDVIENEKTDRVAAKVPFEGEFNNPEVGVWQAVMTVLRNAFIKALAPRLDRTIQSNDV